MRTGVAMTCFFTVSKKLEGNAFQLFYLHASVFGSYGSRSACQTASSFAASS